MAEGMGVMRVVSGHKGYSVKINSPWHRKRPLLALLEEHVSVQHQVVGLDSTDRHHLRERGEKKLSAKVAEAIVRWTSHAEPGRRPFMALCTRMLEVQHAQVKV